jgi:hypothetical protein
MLPKNDGDHLQIIRRWAAKGKAGTNPETNEWTFFGRRKFPTSILRWTRCVTPRHGGEEEKDASEIDLPARFTIFISFCAIFFGCFCFNQRADTLIDSGTVRAYTSFRGHADVENLLERTIDLEKLRRRIARLETGAKRHGGGLPVSSGCEALDELLPERGFCRGTLVEWLSAGEGVGAGTLALLAAERACRDGGALAVFDRRREFCPPAAVRLGIEPEKIVVIHADTMADEHWAIDQALRSPAVAAVLAWPEKLDDRTFRRWQLSAEEGGCLALLLRPEAARKEPSWADVRVLVGGISRSGGGNSSRSNQHAGQSVTGVASYSQTGGISYSRRITLLRCRGGNVGCCLDVELDDETYRVHSLDRRRRQVAP